MKITTEILKNTTGANFYWSRLPGKFLNKLTGDDISSHTTLDGPSFTGTVREWYETLVMSILDVSNEIQTKTGKVPNTIVCGRDIMTMIESSVMYKPTLNNHFNSSFDKFNEFDCAINGILSHQFNVHYFPSFYRDFVLVGFNPDAEHPLEIDVVLQYDYNESDLFGKVIVKNLDII